MEEIHRYLDSSKTFTILQDACLGDEVFRNLASIALIVLQARYNLNLRQWIGLLTPIVPNTGSCLLGHLLMSSNALICANLEPFTGKNLFYDRSKIELFSYFALGETSRTRVRHELSLILDKAIQSNLNYTRSMSVRLRNTHKTRSLRSHRLKAADSFALAATEATILEFIALRSRLELICLISIKGSLDEVWPPNRDLRTFKGLRELYLNSYFQAYLQIFAIGYFQYTIQLRLNHDNALRDGVQMPFNFYRDLFYILLFVSPITWGRYIVDSLVEFIVLTRDQICYLESVAEQVKSYHEQVAKMTRCPDQNDRDQIIDKCNKMALKIYIQYSYFMNHTHRLVRVAEGLINRSASLMICNNLICLICYKPNAPLLANVFIGTILVGSLGSYESSLILAAWLRVKCIKSCRLVMSVHHCAHSFTLQQQLGARGSLRGQDMNERDRSLCALVDSSFLWPHLNLLYRRLLPLDNNFFLSRITCKLFQIYDVDEYFVWQFNLGLLSLALSWVKFFVWPQ